MLQVRIHGRGGQGVVTGAEVLSIAFFLDGRYAQAFPSFGSERMGAPVTAFCRVDDREIRLREPVMQPDILVIQDPTLLHQIDLFGGINSGGYVLINSVRTLDELGIGEFLSKLPQEHVRTVPATDIAMRHLGRPLPNLAMVGGVAGILGCPRLESVQAAIRQKFSGSTGAVNSAAAAEAYRYVAASPKAA